MNSFLKNDKGFAGAFLLILAMLFVAAYVIIELSVFFNDILVVNDGLASQGLISERAYNYYETGTQTVKFLPYIIAFALLAWGLVYALEKRGTI